MKNLLKFTWENLPPLVFAPVLIGGIAVAVASGSDSQALKDAEEKGRLTECFDRVNDIDACHRWVYGERLLDPPEGDTAP